MKIKINRNLFNYSLRCLKVIKSNLINRRIKFFKMKIIKLRKFISKLKLDKRIADCHADLWQEQTKYLEWKLEKSSANEFKLKEQIETLLKDKGELRKGVTEYNRILTEEENRIALNLKNRPNLSN